MKIFSKPLNEHPEVPEADEGKLEEIIEYWSARGGADRSVRPADGNGCYVASIGTEKERTIRAAQLAEISNLVRNQGDRVLGEEILHLSRTNPRTLLGPGTAESLACRARDAGANLLVLDAELTASQLRNLEDVAGISISDRESVILNVFLRNARTPRARIQVAIAQLEYLRPRIRGVGINMDQQTGGITGGRGPGETASELLARKIDSRLLSLRKALKRLEQAHRTQRKLRGDCKRLVLVGYTNAGKTTLMNELTGESLSAKDMPFETLDTTSRALSRHGREVIVSDTVGFIRRLPERLLGSFESTLSEIVEADLLLIVTDVSDPEYQLHLQTVHDVLARLGAEDVPRFYIFNKVDRLPEGLSRDYLQQSLEKYPGVFLSSQDREAVLDLKCRLLRLMREDLQFCSLFVPYEARAVFSRIYAETRVVSTEARQDGLEIQIEADVKILEKIQRLLKEVL